MPTSVILDCYTVEPSGLGVPPYLSTYVRAAWSALRQAQPNHDVRYLTIDDVRWCLNNRQPFGGEGVSDPLTYSRSVNRDDAVELLSRAATVVVVAGDKVPSVHLHAVNGSVEEISRALSCVRGQRVLLGPLASYAHGPEFAGLFDAAHTHTITAADLLASTRRAAPYEQIRADRAPMDGLVAQLAWNAIAEIELYRGCTRRNFCSFCNEPGKNLLVTFRTIDDVLEEVGALYDAGVRNFRLGQQTCFFSYLNRDTGAIESLLGEIRRRCSDLEVLHIDNADPLAVASRAGSRIAELVARYCTDGNCAPMGIESFDPEVIAKNTLTCTRDILMRAVDNINVVGAELGPHGMPKLLPGLNLVYGLPGETHKTHALNIQALTAVLDAGYLCHRTNVRQATAYPGTPLEAAGPMVTPPSAEHFDTWKTDIAEIYDLPMKQRVYPLGTTLRDLHSFFVTTRGTWYRRLGSYSIQVVEQHTARELGQRTDLTVAGHSGRYIFGTVQPPVGGDADDNTAATAATMKAG